MREFELLQPTSLSQALDALAGLDVATQPLAGGTDMVVDIRARRAAPNVLVALQKVGELRGITRENGVVRVGASTTIAEFLEHPALVHHETLRQAAFWFANPMIRNLATIAGNIGSASPAGDMLPPLLALDARLELASANGTRTIPLDQFFTAPRKTVRRADELISSILLPVTSGENHSSSAFYKLGLRRADAISLISVAVWLAREGEIIRDVRIALGAVAPRPLRTVSAEIVLRGQVLTDSILTEAARVAARECAPIDDLRASARYRRRMVEVYTRRMIEKAWHTAV